jgi:hypothetical protein
VENAVVTGSWTAVSRIAAAATAMTMATTQAATKLRMGILQFVGVLNEFSETHSRMVARNSQGPLSEIWTILRYNILTRKVIFQQYVRNEVCVSCIRLLMYVKVRNGVPGKGTIWVGSLGDLLAAFGLEKLSLDSHHRCLDIR